MFPVFSLVLDKDVKSEVAMLYPELYKDLLKVFTVHLMVHVNLQKEKAFVTTLLNFLIISGSTTFLQNIPHMGFDKYLPR